MIGLSTNKRCTKSAKCLRGAGKEFVIRYYSETTQQPEKHLTPGEANALHDAGLRIAVVYQDRQTQPSDFSNSSGERDGRFAWQYAREIGQPHGTTIFFAVDYDAQPAHLNGIKSYFRGAAAGLVAASGQSAPYQIGVYGNGYICKRLKEAGLVKHTWLSESTGHLESGNYTDWNVKQFVTNLELCNLPARSWQRCESKGDDQSWCFQLDGADGTPDKNPVTIPLGSNAPTLRRGDSGEHVITLQRLINRWLTMNRLIT